jgi:ssDNA-binding Zn-finger/Zn-ribbon topoisomerase 1
MIAARKGKCPHCGHDHDAENQEFRRLLSETTAPRAAETGEDAELARFLVAGDLSIMFHDGKGRSLSVEEKVTILNALCASSRPAIIEECARVAASAHWYAHEPLPKCVHAIQALAPGVQNAAVDEMRVQCPKCSKPVNYVYCPYCGANQDAPAPAEVAEGAGEALNDLIRLLEQRYRDMGDTLARKAATALRAAPSLSREEWAVISSALSAYAMGSRAFDALLAKVREAGK